ncbi:LysR substrate-binding domain-containing protein [Paenirhodobacter populi]|uniref:LysR family transcriptional regulator n=1 Tax=Paenirhodobacter populi TaxID=2306993 RepID=A0A443J8S9_9RHOB|nr:LysR substrate-binding domain-containing protein [Sinirhodobacter populi]RWR04336.1 LysR family transcriptional regulator [Sinirhodobacter populi]RWR16889.1 LysR family transcriptional regulator [Sinirhodobacter populi]
MRPVRRRYLPSLGALATFEVAAKHLSFTLAAKELNITQGAVSQQIRLLEKALEVELFIRKHNALELTVAGRGLLGAVVAGLDMISAGVGLLQPTADPQTITISATDALATYWLKPLIDSFRATQPQIEFVVLASDEDAALSSYDDVDIALLCGNERSDVGEELHFMFHEVAQPVCTPEYLAAHGPFTTPEMFNDATLLHLHERHWSASSIQWHPLGWQEWFHAQGVRGQRGSSSFTTNKVPLLMEAALRGEGVMMGIHNLVRNHVEAGALVYAHPASITAGRANFMKCNSLTRKRPAVSGFIDYLLRALRG